MSQNRVITAAIKFLASGGYVGYMPIAPSTCGCVLGVVLYYCLFIGKPLWLYILYVSILVALSIWVASKAERIFGKKDAQRIVIDEIISYPICMIGTVPTVFNIAITFILNRIFDVVKPWPLRQLQQLRCGFGIVFDDIGASLYTLMLMHILNILL